MPWLVAIGTTLLGMFADSLKGLVGRVLVSLGIGAVTATGINALMNYALSFAQFGGGSAQFQAAIQSIGIPWFISTLLSAVTTRMTIRGLTSDSFSFWRMRKQIQ
jgi:hypothetical protein